MFRTPPRHRMRDISFIANRAHGKRVRPNRPIRLSEERL